MPGTTRKPQGKSLADLLGENKDKETNAPDASEGATNPATLDETNSTFGINPPVQSGPGESSSTNESERTQAVAKEDEKNDVPEHLTSDVDKQHNYKDLEKGTFDDTVDSKSGARGEVVSLKESNAVHTGITDNYPNDFQVPSEYPPNESALTTRQVTQRFYAEPAQNDDKGFPSERKEFASTTNVEDDENAEHNGQEV